MYTVPRRSGFHPQLPEHNIYFLDNATLAPKYLKGTPCTCTTVFFLNNAFLVSNHLAMNKIKCIHTGLNDAVARLVLKAGGREVFKCLSALF
jgi:hypothetical protein